MDIQDTNKSADPKAGVRDAEASGGSTTTLEGFTHISVLLEPIRRVLGERRPDLHRKDHSGLGFRGPSPHASLAAAHAVDTETAPLVEETFKDAITGREVSLQDMMDAMMGRA